mmetsp:Transcript_41415/g.88254  ORF Transcript_41415/g.88254 Transcript_41415/m.88254 type:complete len:518 (+) Transcript_41415:130-1683(+)
MVTITKSPKRTRIATAFRTAAISAALLILLWVGLHWLSLVSSLIGSSERDPKDIGNDTSSRTQDDNERRQRSLPKTAGAARPEQTTQQLTESILTRLDELSRIVPLSPESKEDGADDGGGGKESEFLSNVRKECVPGRDDSGGEINPTTRRRRECLRHVPLGKKDAAIAVAGDVEAEGLELEGRVRRQRPRIGIMVPPGRVSATFAAWVEGALRSTGEGIQMDVEVVTTSRAPVYGYGKSHGYTKLVRFVALPAPLAAYDAYLWASSDDDGRDSLRDAADEMELGRNSSPPSSSAVGRTLQLILRWHCRLSRESTLFSRFMFKETEFFFVVHLILHSSFRRICAYGHAHNFTGGRAQRPRGCPGSHPGLRLEGGLGVGGPRREASSAGAAAATGLETEDGGPDQGRSRRLVIERNARADVAGPGRSDVVRGRPGVPKIDAGRLRQRNEAIGGHDRLALSFLLGGRGERRRKRRNAGASTAVGRNGPQLQRRRSVRPVCREKGSMRGETRRSMQMNDA